MLHYLKLALFSIIVTTICVAAPFSSQAEIKAQGTFTGTMSGEAKGAGKLSGPVSITIKDSSVNGTLSGKSSTGDSFQGTITGRYDSKTGALKATYKGKFNRVLGGKNIGAVPMKGSMNGKLSGSKFKGKWVGRGFGTWSASGGKVTSKTIQEEARPKTAEKAEWKPVEKADGLKIDTADGGKTSKIINTSDQLRAVSADIAGRDIEISLMPEASVRVKQTPKKADVKSGSSIVKVLPQVPSELLVAVGGSADFAIMEAQQHFSTIQVMHTEFVLLDTNKESSVKVIKGAVKYTSKANGKSVTVSKGESCTATAKGLGKVEKFDLSAEKKKWKKAANDAGISRSWFGCTLNPSGN